MTVTKARYPAPDRSSFSPGAFVDDATMPEGDLGAEVGVLRDGRPFRLESWWSEGYTLVTAFFSVLDLEDATPGQLLSLLERVLEEARVPRERRTLSPEDVRQIDDARGNRMYSLTFVVGEPD